MSSFWVCLELCDYWWIQWTTSFGGLIFCFEIKFWFYLPSFINERNAGVFLIECKAVLNTNTVSSWFEKNNYFVLVWFKVEFKYFTIWLSDLSFNLIFSSVNCFANSSVIFKELKGDMWVFISGKRKFKKKLIKIGFMELLSGGMELCECDIIDAMRRHR